MKGVRSISKKKELAAYVYLIPGTVLMVAFVIVPVVLSLVMSFFEIKSLGMNWLWVGLENYGRVFRTSGWLDAMIRTVGFGAWGIFTGLFFGLVLAFFVAKHKLLNTYRYIFYLPAVVSPITTGRLYNYLLSPTESGFMNQLIMLFGATEPVNWLGEDYIVTLVVLGMGLIGAGGGMNLVMFTTAINNVPQTIIESAKIEGASSFQIATKIELPYIKPLITTVIVLGIIGSFKSFEGLYALLPNSSAVETIGVLLYKESIASSYGYGLASAMGVVLTLIVMTLMSIYVFWPAKKENE